jgi:outer membrane protein assembly factor BamB
VTTPTPIHFLRNDGLGPPDIKNNLLFRFTLVLLLVFTYGVNCLSQTPVAQATPTAHIAWSKHLGTATYRLQIANDEQFNDVLFDSLITGFDYMVQDLAPGRYFWRVAPAGTETVKFFKAVPFEVRLTKSMVLSESIVKQPVVLPAANTSVRTRHVLPGWSVATGEIVRLISVQLRRGAPRDFLGVNSQGKIYALDGTRGIALWTAHFNLGAAGDERVRTLYNQFAPLVLESKTGTKVVVAFDKGIRALDGSTGREVWSTRIAGRPASGTLIEPDIYLVGEKADRLLVLDSNSGQLKSQIELRDDAVGPPVLLTNEGEPQLLIALKNGLIEIDTVGGKYVRSFRMGTEITTPPTIVRTPTRSVLLIGLKNGLAAFDASTVEPLGRIAIEGGDYPLGTLSIVDLNGDSVPEAIMTTNSGRVISVDVADGKINWSTKVGDEITVPAFADLDADAKLDVVLPGANNFAVGISGMSGSVIWESGEDAAPTSNKSSLRSLAVATVKDGRLMLVGTDPAAAGLRAFEVTKSSPGSTP